MALKEWKLELGVVCEEAEAEADVNDVEGEGEGEGEVKAGGGFPREAERRIIEV